MVLCAAGLLYRAVGVLRQGRVPARAFLKCCFVLCRRRASLVVGMRAWRCVRTRLPYSHGVLPFASGMAGTVERPAASTARRLVIGVPLAAGAMLAQGFSAAAEVRACAVHMRLPWCLATGSTIKLTKITSGGDGGFAHACVRCVRCVRCVQCVLRAMRGALRCVWFASFGEVLDALDGLSHPFSGGAEPA